MKVTFRNVLTGAERDVDVDSGQSVKQAAERAGVVAPGNNFSVRDKDGKVVDNEPVADHEERVLTIGLAGPVSGGVREWDADDGQVQTAARSGPAGRAGRC